MIVYCPNDMFLIYCIGVIAFWQFFFFFVKAYMIEIA